MKKLLVLITLILLSNTVFASSKCISSPFDPSLTTIMGEEDIFGQWILKHDEIDHTIIFYMNMVEGTIKMTELLSGSVGYTQNIELCKNDNGTTSMKVDLDQYAYKLIRNSAGKLIMRKENSHGDMRTYLSAQVEVK